MRVNCFLNEFYLGSNQVLVRCYQTNQHSSLHLTKMKIICRFSIKLELIFPNNSLFSYNFNITENCKSRSYVVNKRGIFNSMMLLGALSKGKLFFKSYLTSLESKTKMLFNQPTILAKPILRRYFPLNVTNFTFFK